ncbi:hypothetical protein DY000_02000979 [Brassica cretica]|uniref:Uncharacterized protein n=1 Tax=Brassica cretica TaxID=69181 RepID=A0ABQ7CFZ9_BRACR|nr:hypothetical protein DY000_02000979 [Brassica cretica]
MGNATNHSKPQALKLVNHEISTKQAKKKFRTREISSDRSDRRVALTEPPRAGHRRRYGLDYITIPSPKSVNTRTAAPFEFQFSGFLPI